MNERCRLKLLPLDANGVPRYDEQTGEVLVSSLGFLLEIIVETIVFQIPEDDFLLYKGVCDKTMILLDNWIDNREKAEEELSKIADEVSEKP